MPVPHPRLSAALAIAIVAIPAGGDALAHPSADVTPTRASLNASALLLHRSDVPGLVTYDFSSGRLSLWESAEREEAQRKVLSQNGWRGGARRTFGQLPTSLYGVLVVESRVFVFAGERGARAAFSQLAPSGLHRVAGLLPVARGARVYAHQDTVSGISELALATQFRQANVISRVMIVGTPGTITRANLAATARRQAIRVARALPA